MVVTTNREESTRRAASTLVSIISPDFYHFGQRSKLILDLINTQVYCRLGRDLEKLLHKAEVAESVRQNMSAVAATLQLLIWS